MAKRAKTGESDITKVNDVAYTNKKKKIKKEN